MTDLTNIADDLAFVRKTVSQSNKSVFPSSILFLWAGLVLVGSILLDIEAMLGGVFWLIAGPAGGLVSAFLGWRWSIALGVENTDEARRQGLHWGGLLAALIVSQLLVMTGAMRGDAFDAQVLIIVSLSYYYAGIHMHRSLLWLAAIQTAAFFAVVLIPGLPATVTGVAIAAGFVWLGVVAHRHLSRNAVPHLEQ